MRTLLTPCLGFLILAGAEEKKLPPRIENALQKATEVEVFALDPDATPGKDPFHGWQVRDRGTLKEGDVKKLVQAIQRGVSESDGVTRLCFVPRHGIRIKRNETTIDLVLCFQCLQGKIYLDDKPAGDFSISDGPLAVLNVLFDKNKIKRVDRKKDD
jgi:hypothetical protein